MTNKTTNADTSTVKSFVGYNKRDASSIFLEVTTHYTIADGVIDTTSRYCDEYGNTVDANMIKAYV